MLTPVIVIVAFDRVNSLNRILTSIKNAYYTHDNISLIISIDKSENNKDVLELANSFEWLNGEKIVKYQIHNLGLKKHILKCMTYVYKYESMIMLEDDLFVSPDFYNYSQQALTFSKFQNNVAGISLYNHNLNVHNDQNFSPIEDGYDNWYFQFASSWGQAWSSENIRDFLNWYDSKPEINNLENIPLFVRNWPEKSWLKYFIAYVVLKNKFFIYPKISLTTNFGDQGTNMDISNTYFQVPLFNSIQKKYNFSSIENSNSIYDSFFENMNLYPKEESLITNKKITIDLYGNKIINDKQYLLTCKILNYKTIKTYGRNLKPHDMNISYNIDGNDFFLYDTNHYALNKNSKKTFHILDYNKKMITLVDSFILFNNKLKQRVLNLFK